MLEGVYCLELNNTDSKQPPDVDVVFVHGLASGAEDAWKSNNGDLWPLWLKHIVRTARIILLNYPAPTFFASTASRVTIKERAQNLADFLPTIGIGNRPTIFVCHSLGGIIIKEIIRCCIETVSTVNIAANTIGVVFLATPHGGSDIANWSDWIGSSLTADLATGSKYLVELRTWFSEYAGQKGLFLSAYCETQTYKNLIIVDKGSADPQCKNCKVIPLDADHCSIAKPISPNFDTFLRIKRDIESATERVEQMSKKLSSIHDVLLLPDLTNKMYFDVINFLNVFFSATSRQGIIISNPCGGQKPCSIIITKDEELIRDIIPLQERFPDRFSIHSGILGEFTARKLRRTRALVRPPKRRQAKSKKTPGAFDFIISALKRIFSLSIKVKVSIAFKLDEDILVLTAAHLVDSIIHQMALKWVGEQDEDVAVKAKKTSKGRQVKQYFKTLSLFDREECLRVIKSEIYQTNKFQASLFSYRTKAYEHKFSCHIYHFDFMHDAMFLRFKANVEENEKLESWCKHHLYWADSLSDFRAPFVGERCRTAEEPNEYLTIESMDEKVFFPIHDKMTLLRNIMVLSGVSAKRESSGAPVLGSNGEVIGMIVGRTNQGGEFKYLAINVLRALEGFFGIRKAISDIGADRTEINANK